MYKQRDSCLYMCLISLILVKNYGHIFVILTKSTKLPQKYIKKIDKNRQNCCIISTKTENFHKITVQYQLKNCLLLKNYNKISTQKSKIILKIRNYVDLKMKKLEDNIDQKIENYFKITKIVTLNFELFQKYAMISKNKSPIT